MSGNILDVKVMRALIKREFQEQRVLFLYIPVAIATLLLVAFIAKLISSAQAGFLWEGLNFAPRPLRGDVPPVDGSVAAFANLPSEMRLFTLDMLFTTSSMLLLTAYWFSTVFYFLLTLYQSRKERSILFWNSMPVSDAQTIVSKLLSCQLGSLAVYLGCLFVLHLLLLGSLVVYGVAAGIDPWETFVAPAQLFSRYFILVTGSLLGLLWTLPIHGWLLFSSARSPSIPFIWAAGPIVTILALENYLSEENRISSMIASHILPVEMFNMNDGKDIFGLVQRVSWFDMAAGVAIGLALIYAAIRFNRPDEI